MPGWELQGRLDAQLPILAYLTAWPLRLTGVLSVIYGILITVAGLLRGDEGLPNLLGMSANIWISLFGIALALVGALKIFVANSVRRFARWAYVTVIVLTAVATAAKVLGPALPPESSQVVVIGWWIDTWMTIGAGLFAMALLVTSFVRRPGA